MGALDPAKILVILVVAMIVLGPERLPRVARQIGGVWRELTRIREQVVDEVRGAMPEELQNGSFLPHIPRPVPGAVSGFVSGLMATNTADANTEPLKANEAIEASTDEEDGTVSEVSGQAPVVRDVSHGSVVMHPMFGDIAILPDDPSMN